MFLNGFGHLFKMFLRDILLVTIRQIAIAGYNTELYYDNFRRLVLHVFFLTQYSKLRRESMEKDDTVVCAHSLKKNGKHSCGRQK